MSLLLPLLLALLGLLLVLLPVLRVRFTGIRLGSTALKLTQPIEFGSGGAAILSFVAGLACLAGAGLLVGLPGGIRLGAGPPPTPPPAEEIGFVEADDGTGRVTIRLLLPDTMAGYTIAEEQADFEATATAEALLGPVNSVTCIAFRASGTEIAAGESYRAAGTFDWPRTGYLYCVSHLGMWGLSRFDNGIPTYLEDFQQSNAIRKTTANRLGVRAVGDEFALTINDVEVGRVRDDRYARGRVQITCGTPVDETPAAVCHFDEYDVQPVP